MFYPGLILSNSIFILRKVILTFWLILQSVDPQLHRIVLFYDVYFTKKCIKDYRNLFKSVFGAWKANIQIRAIDPALCLSSDSASHPRLKGELDFRRSLSWPCLHDRLKCIWSGTYRRWLAALSYSRPKASLVCPVTYRESSHLSTLTSGCS